MARDLCRVRLIPIGVDIAAEVGTPLRGLLFEHGVEFPCGGNGRCRGCKIRMIDGVTPPGSDDLQHLSPEEIASGWRLACRAEVVGDMTLELRQWDASILSNDSGFAFTPQEGLGVAVDLGTTTLVTQLLDLSTGKVLAVRSALNSQAKYGADVMSRIQFAVEQYGANTLRDVIRLDIAKMIHQMMAMAKLPVAIPITKVVVVGNSAMHHLFCGIDCEPLAQVPFEPKNDGLQILTSHELSWQYLPKTAKVYFLPCLGGFVGSDVLAGILATGIDRQTNQLSCLLDLGTNGEIVVGNTSRLLCASTAAGPAFEGARISMGMRASTGAIWRVRPHGAEFVCEVLGDIEARGICGSGLVDAIAAGLTINAIGKSGRLSSSELILSENVSLSQSDIRQVQLAKGAIAAGVRILLKQWGAGLGDVTQVLLAGAFGNYIDRDSAARIGLLAFPRDRILASGNTALLGAKVALCQADEDYEFTTLRSRVKHVSLSADMEFQNIYVNEMTYP